ncbi:hypothetical protein VTN02DRAFT_2909 [Thermoascus thermophilus]
MGPPPVPYSPPSTAGDNSGVGSGPGPLRHPRPMTAADLHLELEKEQEAVVNRLTRELTLLRQQTASVASTASSTSTNLNDPIDSIHGSHHVSGVHPTSSRRHRSSSNLSSSFPGISGSTAGSVTGIAPSRDSGLPPSRPSGDYPRIGRSREPSFTSTRQSGTSSPSLSSSFQQRGDHFPHSMGHSHRLSLGTGGAAENNPRSMSSSATARYEEAAYHRAELESIKRENEMLRRRVRELEITLKTYRERETQSTNQNPDAAAESSLVSSMRDASLEDTA